MPVQRPLPRSRRAIVWLAADESPVGFQLEWWEGPELVRSIWASVVDAGDLAALALKLDELPRTIDHSFLRALPWIRPGNIAGATHRYKFDMPGWSVPRHIDRWWLHLQTPLPLEGDF